MFAEPWESRAFGMAVALYEAGVFTWPRVPGRADRPDRRWEAAPTEGEHWGYYEHWLGALEDVLADVARCWQTTSPREPRRWRNAPLATTTRTDPQPATGQGPRQGHTRQRATTTGR